MKRFPFLVCFVFLFLLVQPGITAAGSSDTITVTATTRAAMADATGDQERTGGSVFFETSPPGAMIWLDNTGIGTSPFTYFSEKTGTLDVRVWRKGYENYTGTVTVEEGRRVVFYALLTPVSQTTAATPAPVTTVTTIRRSTIEIPTPWPATTESPVDPAIIIGAVAGGIALFLIRHR